MCRFDCKMNFSADSDSGFFCFVFFIPLCFILINKMALGTPTVPERSSPLLRHRSTSNVGTWRRIFDWRPRLPLNVVTGELCCTDTVGLLLL